MPKRGKKYLEAKKIVAQKERYFLEEGIKLAISTAYASFDETLEMAIWLGVDPRSSDQMVRGSVILPHGLGKTVRVVAFCRGEKEEEAKQAGADYVGGEDLVKKIQEGWLDFDKAVATPDMMSVVGRIGKILGPRGMMPNAKAGTVTFDIGRAIKELKAGRVEYRVDKGGVVHSPLGKVSFGFDKLFENSKAFLESVYKAKPSALKGVYIKGVYLSTTMGPGIKIDISNITSYISE